MIWISSWHQLVMSTAGFSIDHATSPLVLAKQTQVRAVFRREPSPPTTDRTEPHYAVNSSGQALRRTRVSVSVSRNVKFGRRFRLSLLVAPRQYTVVSLFSGAMGLDIGMGCTGRFRLLACVEKQPAFCRTIRANHEAGRLPAELVVLERDISTLDPNEVLAAIGMSPGEVDVVVGGPPCQSFSTAGKRQATQDPRGTLLWHYLRFIKCINPKFFIMENVRGLLSAALRHRAISSRPEKGGAPLAEEEQPGSVVAAFAKELQSQSGSRFHMDCFEVNAVNYGAPQLRERAIFIGNRFNSIVEFPEPTHGPASTGGNTPEQLSLFTRTARQLLPWRTLGDALHGLRESNPVRMEFSPRKLEYLAMVPPGSNWRSLPLEVQRESMGSAWHAKGGRSGWWRRLSFDLPCPTLVTMPNHASTALCHPSEVRALTLREYARIQEFPDDWQFCGTPSEQFAQVGNAVPVRLGTIAGEVVSRELDKLATLGWKPFEVVPEAYRIVYVQSHVRTRQWYRAGASVVWDDGGENLSAAYAAPKTSRKVRKLGEVG